MNARSLVGMTMGARKRWLIRDSGLPHLGWMAYEARRRWWERLRIGERLRPCPGCCECTGHGHLYDVTGGGCPHPPTCGGTDVLAKERP